MAKNKNTPSKAQVKTAKVLGRVLPGADGKFYRDRAERYENYRKADGADKAADE